ncbi:hypothetical protein E4K72_19620 [Oxalobacteraceae bacterium OM1]|nr:hypothetical protein E4K72_19620 [Oxalobacteraceae bacterium OM1]
MTFRVSIVAAIIVLAGLASYIAFDRARIAADPDRSLMAYLQCNDLVAARFHTTDADAVPDYRLERAHAKVYAISASMDVDPDPRVERRVDYRCRIKWSGRNEVLPSSWQLLDLQLSDLATPAPTPVTNALH